MWPKTVTSSVGAVAYGVDCSLYRARAEHYTADRVHTGVKSKDGGTIGGMRATELLLQTRRAYDGWLIVAITFMAAAVSIGSSNYAFGLFVEPLESDFGWERTKISGSLSFMAVGSLAGPLIGRLMDRYGARPIITGSMVIFGVSFLLRPMMTELWHWYGLSFLQFVSFSGSAGLPAGRLVPIWFPRSRGRVMGITTMGNNFGGLTMPLVVGFVLATGTWQGGMLVIAALSFVVAALALAFVHESPHRLVEASGHDETASAGERRAPEVRLQGLTVRQALRTPSFYAMTGAMTLGSFTYTTVLPHVGAHLSAEGMSDGRLVALSVSLLAAFGMMGKLTFGYLAERITARRAMMLSLGGQAVALTAMVALPDPPFVWLLVPLFGLHMGAFGTLVSLIVQENFGLRYFGSISGLAQMATVVPFALGPLLAGGSFDLTESYGPAFLTVAALFGIGIMSLTQVGPPRVPLEALGQAGTDG